MTLDDQSTEREELDRELALKVRRPVLPVIGVCHWCGDDAKGVFCSPECLQDHEKQERFNR